MKITLALVTSVDGKITKFNSPNINEWTSKEDRVFFSYLVKQHDVIIIGSKTYDAIKQNLKLNKGKLRVVLTHDLGKYSSQVIPGQLEFSDESPQKLIDRLYALGFQKFLLAAGSIVTTSFLKAGLVDEIYLTIEPVIFGYGKTFLSEESMNVDLTLISMKQLNKQGTLLLQYKLKNERN